MMDYGIRIFRAVPCFGARLSSSAQFCWNLDGLLLDATQQHDARLLDTPPPPACCVYNETFPVDFGVEMGGKAGYESVFEDYHAAEGSGRESGESFTLLAIHSATK